MIYRPILQEDVVAVSHFVVEALRDVEPYGEEPDLYHLMVESDRRIFSPQCINMLAEDAGRVVGVCIVDLFSPIYTPALMSNVCFWYVAPSHRGTMAGPRLLKLARKWAADRGAKKHICTVNSTHDIPRIGRLVERIGYKKTGVEYVA